MINQKLSAIRY